jgi:hypothetical protein
MVTEIESAQHAGGDACSPTRVKTQLAKIPRHRPRCAMALWIGTGETRIHPVSGLSISRIRKVAPETQSDEASRATATKRLRGENIPQAAKITLSQNTMVTSNATEIEPFLWIMRNHRELAISSEI